MVTSMRLLSLQNCWGYCLKVTGIPMLLSLMLLRTRSWWHISTNSFTTSSGTSGPKKPFPKFADCIRYALVKVIIEWYIIVYHQKTLLNLWNELFPSSFNALHYSIRQTIFDESNIFISFMTFISLQHQHGQKNLCLSIFPDSHSSYCITVCILQYGYVITIVSGISTHECFNII